MASPSRQDDESAGWTRDSLGKKSVLGFSSVPFLINLSDGLTDSCRDEQLTSICRRRTAGWKNDNEKIERESRERAMRDTADEISQRKIE